jgi:methyl-accepting chemotaxis protein
MRQWARELEELAGHANEQAQADQAGYRGFRRDSNFLKSIDHFARRAREFRLKMDSYRTRPWNVDDEVEHLLRDAREVQRRLQRARFVERHTAEDWSRVVDLLNRTLNEYRSPGTYRGGRYGDGRYRGSADTRANTYPDTRSNDGYYNPNGSSRYSTDLRRLAQELDERASRAEELAGRYNSGYASNIRHFSEQARSFRDRVENSRISGSELRSQVNHLLEDAQEAQEELRRTRVSSDLAAEWDGIVRVLTRMRDLAV